MPSKQRVLEDLDFLTDKLSSLSWHLNLGALGITWTLLIAVVPAHLRFSVRNALWVFVPCVLSMVGEMAQYLVAYIMTRRACKKMESEGLDDIQFDERDFFYRARRFFFWWKIILAVIAAVILLYTLVQKFFA